MLTEKELRRHKELAVLNSHLSEIMRMAVQTNKSAEEVCAVISQMIDSFQYGRIKQERDAQAYRDWENKTYGEAYDDDPHLFI